MTAVPSPAAPTPADALRATHGNLSAAALRLHVTRGEMAAIVDADPALAALVDDCRAELVDYAETQLWNAIGKGEDWAIRYALDSTRASPRGWRKPSAAAASQAAQTQQAATPPAGDAEPEDMAAQIRREMGLDD
jgi:hypothetical protein